jgi:hypothetical protein
MTLIGNWVWILSAMRTGAPISVEIVRESSDCRAARPSWSLRRKSARSRAVRADQAGNAARAAATA